MNNYRYGRPTPEPKGFYGNNHDDWVLSEKHSEPEMFRLTSDQLFTMYINAYQRYIVYTSPELSEPYDDLYSIGVKYLCIGERCLRFYVVRLKEEMSR